MSAVQPRRDFLKLASLVSASAFVGPVAAAGNTEVAIFAGGCFWCMEKPYDVLPGVKSTTSGYCGGNEKNPTYKAVGSGKTGHAESMRVEYDPSQVSYEQLLDVFWHNIDPTTVNKEFCDTGKQYRTAIFYLNEEQKIAALASKKRYEESNVFGKKIVTEISPAKTFWEAEDYHQDYYKKNPQLYAFYRANCGRDRYLESIWGESGSSFSITDIPSAVKQRLSKPNSD